MIELGTKGIRAVDEGQGQVHPAPDKLLNSEGGMTPSPVRSLQCPTDIDMPGSMDGLKLAAAVRDRWPPVEIVIASGKHRPARDEMPNRSVFLPKSYLSNEIRVAINRAVNAA